MALEIAAAQARANSGEDDETVVLHHGEIISLNKYTAIKKSGVCENCRLRPATLDWYGEGGALAFTHGFFERWCELCATEYQIEFAERQIRDCTERLPELRSKLLTLRQHERGSNVRDIISGRS